MNCLEFEQKLGTDPEHIGAEAQHHAAHCAQCQERLRESQRIEQALRHAFGTGRLTPSGDLSAMSGFARPTLNRRWFAFGGAATAASMAGFFVSRYLSGAELPDELIAHISTASLALDSPLPRTVVIDVLKSAKISLSDEELSVSYANNCLVRGWITAHLVLQTKSGPMTAFLMPAVSTEAVAIFERTPWTGRISPYQGGSIAVLGFNQKACADTEDRLRRSVLFQLT
jgi:hypothetical protein